MAASLSLTQLSSGNPIYDKYYRQVDPTSSGRVAAADAALFLKRSGLPDLVLGKIWDLADSERKGSLNKQQFFIALRLVACAQNGLEVALKSLNVAVPPPKFHDTSSPLSVGGVTADNSWVVKPEEKMKFDSVFESLLPVGGMLTGEKVKPVLLNSKLPVDILGRVWELSDLDRDGMLDRDEFSVAMYLVYRALEGEPVPMSLPPPLIPPSKRKKPSAPPVMPLLPSPPSVKDSRSSHSAKTMPHPPPKPTPAPWVVSPSDKAKYDELFSKTDGDMDGLVSGPEVRDIFLKTGLPSATLARIWELCDIGDIGKLTREQFALALFLINLKLTKGLDPPQSLSPEMIPPSDRQNLKLNNVTNLAADFSAIKELDSLSNEIDLQDEVARENGGLHQLQVQRQKIKDVLEELDQQKASLEEQLSHIRKQTNQETQLISSLQSEHEDQEQQICQYEEELVQAREELLALQKESRRLQEMVQAAQEQLTPLKDSVRDSFTQVAQVQQKLNDLQVEERSVTAQLSWKRALEDSSPIMVNGSAGSAAEAHLGDPFSQDLFQEDPPNELKVEEEEELESVCGLQQDHPDRKDKGLCTHTHTHTHSLCHQSSVAAQQVSSPEPESKQDTTESSETASSLSPPQPGPRNAPVPTNPPSLPDMDFFHSDPFTNRESCFCPISLPVAVDPFDGDPFKGTDPFAADAFFTQTSKATFSSEDPFSGSADPFSATPGVQNPDLFAAHSVGNDTADSDPFGGKMNTTADADPFKSKDAGLDPFSCSPPTSDLAKDSAAGNDPFAPGGTTVNANTDSDPFAAVFGNESFGGGFADFTALAKSNGADQFGINNKNLFQDESKSPTADVPPALPPKTGTPTRPPPPPPGKRSSISRTESSDSFHRRGHLVPQTPGDFSSSSSSSLPAKDPLADPFAPSSPPRHNVREADRFASFDKYPTEEDMIEWAKRESEREEKERLARLTQQEQEDLELAIALSKSELS
uniref:Epidermal growth factor receptor pathway substrate 15 n=1 Tax=Gouania willdenowi TaxID=441366 RepID=A0A8C5EGJ5_GOUWI